VIRLLTKVASFGASLLALWLVWRKGGLEKQMRLFKPSSWLVWMIVMLGVMIFHPDTNSIVAGIAHCVLYISSKHRPCLRGSHYWMGRWYLGRHHYRRCDNRSLWRYVV
jgi:hypothetical protein